MDLSEKYVVFFKTELDTINLFSERMRIYFEECGINTLLFDTTTPLESLTGLYPYLEHGQIAAMVGFNVSFYSYKTPSGINLCEGLNIPCINILLDHPYWYHELLMSMPATAIVLCIDRNHMNYINRFYPNISINGFLPHGGSSSILESYKEMNCKDMCNAAYEDFKDETNSVNSKDVKDIDVVYCGSLYKYEIERIRPDFSRYDFPAEKICEETIEYLINNPDHTIEETVENMMKKEGLSPTDDFLRRFLGTFTYIERVVGSHFRELLIKTLAEEGVNITIYGKGWEDCDFINLENVDYKGFVSPEEILSVIRRSKITLNSMPWFKDGSHERIFNAQLFDSLSVTESNPYLKEALLPDTYLEYELNQQSMIELAGEIKNLLLAPEKLKAMTDKAKEHALANHTWESRAQELIEFLEVY